MTETSIITDIIQSLATRADVVIVVLFFFVYLYFRSKDTTKTIGKLVDEVDKVNKDWSNYSKDMGTAKHQQLKETQELNAQQLRDITTSFMAGNERLAQAIERQGSDIRVALERQSDRMEAIMRNTMVDNRELVKYYNRNKVKSA